MKRTDEHTVTLSSCGIILTVKKVNEQWHAITEIPQRITTYQLGQLAVLCTEALKVVSGVAETTFEPQTSAEYFHDR